MHSRARVHPHVTRDCPNTSLLEHPEAKTKIRNIVRASHVVRCCRLIKKRQQQKGYNKWYLQLSNKSQSHQRSRRLSRRHIRVSENRPGFLFSVLGFGFDSGSYLSAWGVSMVILLKAVGVPQNGRCLLSVYWSENAERLSYIAGGGCSTCVHTCAHVCAQGCVFVCGWCGCGWRTGLCMHNLLAEGTW